MRMSYYIRYERDNLEELKRIISNLESFEKNYPCIIDKTISEELDLKNPDTYKREIEVYNSGGEFSVYEIKDMIQHDNKKIPAIEFKIHVPLPPKSQDIKKKKKNYNK